MKRKSELILAITQFVFLFIFRIKRNEEKEREREKACKHFDRSIFQLSKIKTLRVVVAWFELETKNKNTKMSQNIYIF